MKELDLIKSSNDKKDYKYLKLSNGIAVLLIHDPAVAEALAAEDGKQAMDVSEDGEQQSGSGSGSGSDDDEDMSGSGSEEGSSGSEEDEGEESDEEEAGGKKGKKQKGQMAGSKKAAAAMAVGVGSFSDPSEMQGLSHYLEHMLFMGSDKFPDENEYDAYLSKHGGSSNAFTELEFTNYHFEVAPAHLEGALDRFAQFFVAPLFKAGALEREVQAVDSEFSGVLQSDHSRLAQLMCHTSKAGHIYNKFSWGNLASLWSQPRAAGIDVRQRIIDYYRAQYGPARMSLVLLGGQPLDQLESWVRQLFDAVPQGVAGPPPAFSDAGMPFEGRVLYVAPAVKEHHEVTVTFQLPCLRPLYASKPDHYISHLVGHEGPGSLLAALKARGWAIELCAGVDDDGYSANTAAYLFTVSIVLTEAGLAAGPGCGLAPVALLFQYLRLLTETGPQAWVWQEIAAIAGMKFRFAEEEDSCDLVTRLASNMSWVAPQHLLAAEYLHEEWQPEKVAELLQCMQPASSSFRIDLLTKSYAAVQQQLQEAAADPTSWLSSGDSSSSSRVQGFTEPWFKMDALLVKLPDSLTGGWAESAVADDLALPPPNPYIPSDFELKTDGSTAAAAAAAAADSKQLLAAVAPWMLVGGAAAAEAQPEMLLAAPPAMLLDEPGLRLWHKLASSYQQPRACAYFRLAGPAAAASAVAAVLGALWMRLVEEALAEDAYLADVAGLHCSCSSEGAAGFELRVDGFSHKLGLLAGRVFEALAGCKVRPHTFPAVHEQLLRRYRNAMLQPGKAAAALRLQCLAGGPHWSADELAAALEQVKDVAEVQAFASQFLSCCHMEGLTIGNITAKEAEALARSLRTTLSQQGGAAGATNGSSSSSRDVKLLAADDRLVEQCVVLPSGVALLHKAAARNPEEENCCVEAYYQIGMSTDLRLRVLTDLMDQVLYEPVYDTLRTKQQLGYSVSSGARLTHGVCGFCVVVVSPAFSAAEVEGRIEAFLQDFAGTLQAMPQEEFGRHKAALASNKLQKDTALAQEADRAWEQVFNARYEFICKEQEAALLQSITLAELQQFYATHVAPSSAQRRKLTVRVIPNRQGKATAAAAAQGAEKGDKQQQQQQHVQHEHGMVEPNSPRQGGKHIVGAEVVTAGCGAAAEQQNGDAAAAAAAAAGSPGSRQLQAKRQRRQQAEEQPAEAAAAAGGGEVDAAALLAPGVQLQVVSDPVQFKQGRERYPGYCTVVPQLAQQQ
ncbi:hypothetical protein OEZ85_014121 [Tetradesmus obliquus]|uniref:Peptidase M16 N-terminal domain-containing protein n=1 Tax=Tetradesmus obliquus TaxID=3088 RepID=A0ABY8U702_TETOB|nr:hypothetical protein OEZ85_014121 [Tetradesmus obliquus]